MDEISSISAIEQVEILATFNVLHDSTFQCGVCKKRLPVVDRDTRKGCKTNLASPFSSWRDLIKFRRCPANYYSAYWAMTIDNFRHYSNGVLPYNGSLMEQPSKVMEAYNFINNLKVEYENDILAKQAKQAKRK